MTIVHFRYLTYITVLLAWFWAGSIVSAQDDSELETELESLYKSRNYNSLETYALKQLHQSDSLTITGRALLYKYLGIVYVIQGRPDDGRIEFHRWLLLDPNGFIDSFSYPPPIVRVFEEAKSGIEREKVQPPEIVPLWKPGPASVVKSLLVPGWGQLLQSKNNKAIGLFSLQVISISGWIVCEHNMTIENRKYHLETDPSRFDELYDSANRWNYARWAFALSSSAIYLLTQADFFLLPPSLTADNLDTASGPAHPSSGTYSSSEDYQEILRITIQF